MSVPAWRTHYTPVAPVYVVSELEESRLQTPQSLENMLKSWCRTLGVEWTQRRSTTYSGPSFLSKEVAKSTAPGLAIVYGLVEQRRGFVTVYSEPGQRSA
jgi:hypothetical protein